MSIETVSVDFWGRKFTVETGKVAKQASGAVTVRCGDTIVLVAAALTPNPKEGYDFLPLTVQYVEKTFAAGKIPGGFFKREGRPSEIETLTSRFIDRPVRPLFPKNFRHEMQVIATVLSADPANEPDILAMTGASAALMLSEAPFDGPIAGVRVGRIDGKLCCNPVPSDMEKSDIDLIIAGSEDAIVMVEGGALETSEKDIIDAIIFGHKSMQPLIQIQKELAGRLGKKKFVVEKGDEEMIVKIREGFGKDIREALRITVKGDRSERMSAIKGEAAKKIVPEENPEGAIAFEQAFKEVESAFMGDMILNDRTRIDGRGFANIRPITCEVSVLPRAHGSALFTRGETQALVATTLGSEDDAQILDGIREGGEKRFMLHYNFPPFSVGEVRRLGSPGRREIGHGALAERAIRSMLPGEAECPYTIRIVSEILESNGSSSMATVCGASLSLMDAGIKIKRPVAGIAMGLVKRESKVAILSDILGDEDHLGDMDFKVAGTEQGITALQMDVKVKGVSESLLVDALKQAREGRLHILSEMAKVMPAPRIEMSEYAPRIVKININPERIRDLIGPGGKVIKGIAKETGAKIDVVDSGEVTIFSASKEALEKALAKVKEVTAEAEMGKVYEGTVQRIMEYGAFVEILPGQDGLLHVSQIDFARTENVRDVLKEGDVIPVKVIRIDPSGKVSLSRKDALRELGKK